jgi:epoxyqueuosine reductase QueG
MEDCGISGSDFRQLCGKDLIYGCDIYQNAYPINKEGEGIEEFSGLSECSPALTLENIQKMGEAFYQEKIQPKFFYLSPEELWQWEVNALNFMLNYYQEKYKLYILAACESENEKIRELAQLNTTKLPIFG